MTDPMEDVHPSLRVAPANQKLVRERAPHAARNAAAIFFFVLAVITCVNMVPFLFYALLGAPISYGGGLNVSGGDAGKHAFVFINDEIMDIALLGTLVPLVGNLTLAIKTRDQSDTSGNTLAVIGTVLSAVCLLIVIVNGVSLSQQY